MLLTSNAGSESRPEHKCFLEFFLVAIMINAPRILVGGYQAGERCPELKGSTQQPFVRFACGFKLFVYQSACLLA